MVAKLLRWFLFTLFFWGLLFGLAGRRDLPLLWAYLVVCSILALLAILTIDPGLAEERRRPGPGGTDRAMRWIAGPLYLAHLVIAALDVGRFHWSDSVPQVGQGIALALFSIAMPLVVWAMAVNRFFSPVVRIQAERGHHLLTGGPYRYVRHPGYIGMIIAIPASAIALGSWWALAPALLFSLLILRRTRIEDRFLQQHLSGYLDYAGQVRYRLVPGLW